jgi:hypothetical protein
MNANLDRTHFNISRSAEYFDIKELQAQTGQPVAKFGEVVLKELIDNALDACESAGIDPVIHIGIATVGIRMQICVSDNGSGISKKVIDSILDFDTRTSDKAAYKAPTRGAQGNAFKTIIGIPHALGGGRVAIESKDLRHEITAMATPAGTMDINRTVSPITDKAGTAVYVDMPWRESSPYWYARATALFNPHAIVKISTFDDFEALKISMVNPDSESAESSESDDFYNRLAECQKIKPNEPTSAHWYDRNDFVKLVYLQGAQNDIALGKFVRQFRGLSSTGKAKSITNKMPFKLVSDIYRDNRAIESMRLAMQGESKPVQPKALGAVGEANLLKRLYAVDRHWYKQVSGMIDNVPYVFEILIAESEIATGYYFGVNHSPTFGDFLRQCRIQSGELNGAGITGALAEIIDNDQHIVVVHLIGIGLPFLDRGKSNLSLPGEMVESIAGAAWSAAKVLHKECKARLKDAARAGRDQDARTKASANNTSIKDAVFEVLADAIQAATDNGRLPANVRALYYKVRDAIQQHTPKELDYGYFSQTILIDYWKEYERDKLIYNDPRGVLYAPHSESILQLGTLEVDRFIFPEHEYNKVLYIEKKGLWHTLKAANLHKKYDMAVIAGEGYASEAIRVLLEKAQAGQDYTIFVLHDADPDGYNIARTIQDSTKRMPDHNIAVIDLGLKIQDAIDMKLNSETFTRKKELAQDLELNEIEREYFGGNLQVSGTKKSWICRRIELNAMSAGQLVDYVDQGISRAIDAQSLDKKVIPPEPVLVDKANELFRHDLNSRVDEIIRKRLKTDDLKAKLLKIVSGASGVFDEQKFKAGVNEYLADNELETWGDSIQVTVDEKLNDLNDEVAGKITKLVTAAIKAA